MPVEVAWEEFYLGTVLPRVEEEHSVAYSHVDPERTLNYLSNPPPHSIKAIKDDGKTVNRQNTMTYLRRMDFDGATGRISLVHGTNDRDNMPVQIVNSHGYKADGKTVDFVSVGSVNPETGVLTIDESAILWPGATRTPPNR